MNGAVSPDLMVSKSSFIIIIIIVLNDGMFSIQNPVTAPGRGTEALNTAIEAPGLLVYRTPGLSTQTTSETSRQGSSARIIMLHYIEMPSKCFRRHLVMFPYATLRT